MSTSVLMKKMEKYADSKGIDLEVAALGVGQLRDVSAYDVVLLGPQISYQKDAVRKKIGDKPMAVIEMQDYGLGNCEHIFALIDSTLAGR
jgi:PTS system cellobiose-specific IIB component